MQPVNIKPGVKLAGVRVELLAGLIVLGPLFASRGIPMVWTSGVDGNHHPGSLHGLGYAMDLRSSTKFGCPASTDASLLADGKAALGPEFDFILEDVTGPDGEANPNVHFHLEWDARRAGVVE